jgi:S-adenosylmethionine:tRNA ribosyltransferase-isomerase
MRREELQYDLPPELIAQQPAEPRDASRLMVVDRATGGIAHRMFRDLPEYLAGPDLLVLNDTRVIPARFFGRRATGGRVELLFLHVDGDAWQVMLRSSRRLQAGERIACDGADVAIELIERVERGTWRVQPVPAVGVMELLSRVGQTPLPPYIERARPTAADVERYQTVYAQRPGAVAAPTAGLHFTPAVFDALVARGVQRTAVTLHVGAGTFTPIEADALADHRMHAEWYEAPAAAIAALRRTRAAGGRIVAVGTTAVRVLESLPDGAVDPDAAAPAAPSGWTDVFIYPPYTPRHVDVLVTNFHLPGSSLIALVMALAGKELIRAAYAAAIAEGYRFYSYGDAMLIA